METVKKIISWNSLDVGISTFKGERRFPLSPPMRCDYGHIRGTWGKGLDGKSLDVYIAGDKPTVYKIYQIDPKTQKLDEHKYLLGANNIDEAKRIYIEHLSPHHFGGIVEYSIDRLKQDGNLL